MSALACACVQVKLEETFGELEVWLAAENGIYMRPPGADWITLLEARQSFSYCYQPVPCLKTR